MNDKEFLKTIKLLNECRINRMSQALKQTEYVIIPNQNLLCITKETVDMKNLEDMLILSRYKFRDFISLKNI